MIVIRCILYVYQHHTILGAQEEVQCSGSLQWILDRTLPSNNINIVSITLFILWKGEKRNLFQGPFLPTIFSISASITEFFLWKMTNIRDPEHSKQAVCSVINIYRQPQSLCAWTVSSLFPQQKFKINSLFKSRIQRPLTLFSIFSILL